MSVKTPVWICIFHVTTCVLADANSTALWTHLEDGPHLEEPRACEAVWAAGPRGAALTEWGLPARQRSLWTHYFAFTIRLDHLPSWGSPRLWRVFQWSSQKEPFSREADDLHTVHWCVLPIHWVWFGFVMVLLPWTVCLVLLIQEGSFYNHFWHSFPQWKFGNQTALRKKVLFVFKKFYLFMGCAGSS